MPINFRAKEGLMGASTSLFESEWMTEMYIAARREGSSDAEALALLFGLMGGEQ
jgi:hypothetical protein